MPPLSPGLGAQHTLVGMTEKDAPLPAVFTRQQLYDLVWSEPVQSPAKRLSISDRGLSKVCTAANIPVPARGYWAKLQAGKKATSFPLPPRAFGQSDEVRVRRDRWGYERESDEDILSARMRREAIHSRVRVALVGRHVDSQAV
jgi:hypothetical protein